MENRNLNLNVMIILFKNFKELWEQQLETY